MKRRSKQERRYHFFLNPYSDVRFTRCPTCDGKTRQRKLPLLIHVEPRQLLALNKTCRYCPYCDLLIAHQDEIEGLMAAMFAQQDPSLVGNDYLVIGTIDRADWKQGVHEPLAPKDALERMHEFKDVLRFKLTGGWMPRDA